MTTNRPIVVATIAVIVTFIPENNFVGQSLKRANSAEQTNVAEDATEPPTVTPGQVINVC